MKLVHLLIGKSIAETILVGTLAVIFYFTAFPPHFHGWGEATTQGIAGWAVDTASPWDRVEVQLFIDGEFISSGVANLARPDVAAAGWSKDEWHGYQFLKPTLSLGKHEARVYAMHVSGKSVRLTLQQLGDPITFVVDLDGTIRNVSKTKVDNQQR